MFLIRRIHCKVSLPSKPEAWQRACLHFLNPDLSTAARIDFTGCAPEIYDIVFLGMRFTAAAVFRDAFARRLDPLYDQPRAAASLWRRVSARRA